VGGRIRSFQCELDESKQAILCPVTGTIMRKLRLSTSTAHRIDYSASVGGVWLDKGEWDLLKKEGLAGSLNAVLTAHWQRNKADLRAYLLAVDSLHLNN